MLLPLRWLFLLQSSGLVVMQHVRSSRTRDWTLSPALAGRFLFTVPLRKSRRFLLNTAISYDKRWDGGDKILCRDWTKTINGAQALSLINTRTLYTHPHACTHTPYSKPSDVGEQNITGKTLLGSPLQRRVGRTNNSFGGIVCRGHAQYPTFLQTLLFCSRILRSGVCSCQVSSV